MNGFSDLTEVCLKVFNTSASYTNMFFPALFFIRILYANITGASTSEYTDAVKGAITYWILILGFGYILDVLLMLPEAFLPKFDPSKLTQDNLPEEPGVLSGIPEMLHWLMESITAVIYYIATSLHFLFMIVLCAIAPIIILFGAMLGLGIGVKIFFGLMILASCWPLVWAAFDEFNAWTRAVSGNSFGGIVTDMLIQTLKAIAPLWMSSAAIKSGPGKALTGAVTGAMNTAPMVQSMFGGKANPAPGVNIGPNATTAPGVNITPGNSRARDISSANPKSINAPDRQFKLSPTNQGSAGDAGPSAMFSRDIPQASPTAPKFSMTSGSNQSAQSSAADSGQKPENFGSHTHRNAPSQHQNSGSNSPISESRNHGHHSDASRTNGTQTSNLQQQNTAGSSGSSNSSSTLVNSSGTAPSLSPAASSLSTSSTSSGTSGSGPTTFQPASTAPMASASPQTGQASQFGSATAQNSASAPQAPSPTARPTNSRRIKNEDPGDMESLAMKQMLAEQTRKRRS